MTTTSSFTVGEDLSKTFKSNYIGFWVRFGSYIQTASMVPYFVKLEYNRMR